MQQVIQGKLAASERAAILKEMDMLEAELSATDPEH